MRTMGLSKITFMFVAVVLSAAGCCKNEKEMIQVLSGQKQDLLQRNDVLTQQLTQAKDREAQLLSQLGDKSSELAKVKSELDDAKAKLAAVPVAPAKSPLPAEGWQKTAYGDKVTVGSDILFSAGRAALTNAGKRALSKIASDLKGTYAGLPVRVYGHTDSDPIKKTKHLWSDNLDLSANRAMAVTRYLRSRGVKADRVETVAMGQARPITSNATNAGKAKNRRVEIVVIKR